MNDIDFVIPWVDGNDPAWRTEKELYTGLSGSRARFRAWDNLKYLFRAYEKFTPWVNRVHFVTWGHLPPWMNEACPKLHIVNHRDYIPEQYLPTFNSHPIELNMHRIPGLSEQFVYFNDDMFMLRPMRPEQFFKNGLPAERAILYPYRGNPRGSIGNIVSNDMDLINVNFKKGQMVRRNFFKFINWQYGKDLRYTLASLVYPHIVGFSRSHYPNPYLKRTFEILWEKEYEMLDATSQSKVRAPSDVNQWLARFWQMASGQFTPVKFGEKRYYSLGNDNTRALNTIRGQACDIICLNDHDVIQDFELQNKLICEAFETILPEKSSFEI